MKRLDLSHERLANAITGAAAVIGLLVMIIAPLLYISSEAYRLPGENVRALDLINRSNSLITLLNQSSIQPTLSVYLMIVISLLCLAVAIGAGAALWRDDYSWFLARLTLIAGVITLCCLCVLAMQFSILWLHEAAFSLHWGYLLVFAVGVTWIVQALYPRKVRLRQSVEPQQFMTYPHQQNPQPPLIVGEAPLQPLPPQSPPIPSQGPPPPPAYPHPQPHPQAAPIGHVRHVASGRVFNLRFPKTLIGREQMSDICLPEKSISRKHALLEFEPQRQVWGVWNISERNYVIVNQTPLVGNVWQPLQLHDRLQLGDVLLELVP